jgi:hypothetical protein
VPARTALYCLLPRALLRAEGKPLESEVIDLHASNAASVNPKKSNMRRALILLAVAGCVRAGTIQGVVLEHASGRPLARSMVRLDPVPQSGGEKGHPLTLRVGLSGNFVFPTVLPGVYLLTATHAGYFPGAFGARLPLGRGVPIEVTRESTLFAEIRLRHQGAITGRVLDENGVGTSGIPVVAYRARLPLRSAGSALSDDRGVFRIPGLEAGKYWVRSAAYTLADGTGWLPTFGLVAREIRDARVHQVTLNNGTSDNDTSDADISPETGALFRMSGTITCTAPGPLVVTLSSETGRRRIETQCPLLTYQTVFQFDSLAPAVYEVFAGFENGAAAGFTELYLDHDMNGVNLQMAPAPAVDIDVRRAGSNAQLDIPLTLLGRRQDLAEAENEQEISRPRTTLSPGHWEMRARVPAGQYVESIAAQRGSPRRTWSVDHPPDWFEVFIDPRPTRILITVSDKAGQIAGKVTGDKVTGDGKPVAGAPVFLWPVAESARRSLNGALQTLSDTEGRYRFSSLPPGDYRVLASFDVNEIDQDVIELSQAPLIHADASQRATMDLTVWVAPW